MFHPYYTLALPMCFPHIIQVLHSRHLSHRVSLIPVPAAPSGQRRAVCLPHPTHPSPWASPSPTTPLPLGRSLTLPPLRSTPSCLPSSHSGSRPWPPPTAPQVRPVGLPGNALSSPVGPHIQAHQPLSPRRRPRCAHWPAWKCARRLYLGSHPGTLTPPAGAPGGRSTIASCLPCPLNPS